MYPKLSLLITVLSALQISHANRNFNPREYPKHIANCQATTRGSDQVVDLSLRQPRLLSYLAYMN